MRYHREHESLHAAFGGDKFGAACESIARVMGSARYLLLQTVFIVLWMAYNGYAVTHVLHHRAFDPYPWILLNLVFSTQAAYAAPMILLAQTRQATRDKAAEEANARHRQQLADDEAAQLRVNTELTQDIHSMQTAQMKILNILEAPRGGLGGDQAVNSQPGGCQCAPGPERVSGVPGHDQPSDVPGDSGA